MSRIATYWYVWLPLGLLAGLVMLGHVPSTYSDVSPHHAAAKSLGQEQSKLRSKHLIFGVPEARGERFELRDPDTHRTVPGISILVREGFVVGHDDQHKVPAWVSMRWTVDDHRRSSEATRSKRDWASDLELPPYARAATSYENARTGMQRGHMARHADNAAWGSDNSAMGCLMSNAVPQSATLNGGAWARLEDAHRSVVANPASGIRTVWVIAGAVFDDDQPLMLVGNQIGVPNATYKIVAWFKDGRFHARGYIFGQTQPDLEPAAYLVTIDTIEARTGLDFFPELEQNAQKTLEALCPTDCW